MTPPFFFLSRFMIGTSDANVQPSGNAVGNPTRAKGAATWSGQSAGARPSRTARRASSTVPIATASPCWTVKLDAVSTAWPTVWPRFNLPRTPFSNGSSRTQCTFTARARATNAASLSTSPFTSGVSSSRQGSAMKACFIASARPQRHSRAGKVASVSTSASTSDGEWNAPMRFFASGRSHPSCHRLRHPPLKEA